MSYVYRRVLGFALLLHFLAGICSAQVRTGTPPFGSFSGGPDIINVANLNVHLTVPVVNRSGRGTDFTYALSYDSSVWYPVGSSGAQSWQPVIYWGWTGQGPIVAGYVHYDEVDEATCTDSTGQDWVIDRIYQNWIYFDNFGVPHPFNGYSEWRITVTNCPAGKGTVTPLTATATDGSGYTLTASGGIVSSLYSASGQRFRPPVNAPGGAASVTDRNGNEINVDSSGVFTDTLGVTALTVSGAAPSPTTFSYTAPNGQAASFQMNYTTYTVQTKFNCSGISEYGPTSNNLVTEIDLPDIAVNPNDKYTFAYEVTPGDTHSPHYVTGRLASVTLPTGGTISYSYSGGSNGHITCSDGSAATLSRTTPDGAWTYAQVKGTAAASTTTVTDPGGSDTVIQFQGIYETQRQGYQGSHTSGTLLATVNTCYNGSASPCTATAITLPIAQRNVTTILPGGLQSEHDDFWNTYGGPTEVDDYDFGTAPHGSLLKKILATYAALGNIQAFRQSVSVQNGQGQTVSQVNYNYDETPVVATSGTPQQVAVTGNRGNLTSTNTYTQANRSLTKRFTYFDTGNVQTETDVNTAQVTFNYGTASCGNSFPTSVNLPLGLTRSITWNCTGGVQLASTDENGQTTTTLYNDPYFWRPASVTDPTGAATSYCYGLVTSGTCALNLNQFESVLSFNSGNSAIDTLITTDSLGRPHIQQTRQAPGSSYFDSVETDYDSLGRVSRVTLPYSGTEGQTNSGAAATTTAYDALNRPLTVQDGGGNGGGSTTYNYGQGNDVLVARGPAPSGENTKRRQFEYDALGRLASVCEITAGTTAWPGGSCAQNTVQTGYWTKYSYDPMGNLMGLTQNAQMSGSTQSRSYAYDWMSRLTSETVPEIGASGNGTAYYTYDSDSTCGTYTGDLVKNVDAAGNTICYSYDALQRQLTVTYPSGTYAPVTPQKYFVYDTATVNQQTMLNAKGRLAEAYTCFSPCSTKATDVGLSYTVRGEVSDVYESTPNSNGFYYHTAQSYLANGSPYQLTGNIGLPSTMTYGPDGEGRPSTVSASSGQNPASGTTYNAASLPTAINLGSGSGDADTYTYDPNTNRMTQYKFTVKGTSLTGALGWNANATLQSQNITDGFNSADTQNCSYGYDDLTRLASGNCGGAASQTFAYDPFGNIDKSGSPYRVLSRFL